ncbi:MAG: hypothetical protein ACPGWS_01765 [Solirubrobacterales bacterium]
MRNRPLEEPAFGLRLEADFIWYPRDDSFEISNQAYSDWASFSEACSSLGLVGDMGRLAIKNARESERAATPQERTE